MRLVLQIFFLIYLFLYVWLHWVFIAVCGLSLVAVSGARQTPLEHAVYEAQLVQFNPPHSGLCSWFSLTPLTVASAVAVSGGYSSLLCAGFSLWWASLVASTGSRCTGFSNCGSQALERRLSSCGTRA